MPEGPELAIAAAFIQRVCRGKVFTRIVKSAVTKCVDVPWTDGDQFTLSAKSRGKEIMICVQPMVDVLDKKYILFHFGMSGRFTFTNASSTPKHSHLSFITADQSEALSFVDTRRFGKWELKNSVDEWTMDRGPCALTEYELFRQNIADSLGKSVFDRPLCEAMLDQRYFNGIGNYLRAEIIHRAGAQPFDKARTILQPIFEENEGNESGEDLVALCRTLQQEVLGLQGNYYTSSDQYLTDNDKTFDKWLKCYGNPGMNRMTDAYKRTIWFSGPAGSLARRAEKRSVGMAKPKKQPKRVVSSDQAAIPEDEEPVVKRESKREKAVVKKKASSDVTATPELKEPVVKRETVITAKKQKKIVTGTEIKTVTKIKKTGAKVKKESKVISTEITYTRSGAITRNRAKSFGIDVNTEADQ